MIQLLAGSFFILLCGGFAQRSPIDTSVPIVRISPPLKNNGSNDSDSFGFAIAFYQLDPVLSTNLASWRLVVGAPRGTYPGGLYLNNPSCMGNPPQRNGLVYLCSIQPGKEICDGAVGNGTTNNGRLFDCIGESTSPNPQMGASLFSYGGYLLACAPTWTIGSLSQASFKGACYMSFNNSLRTFSRIMPCGPKAPNSLSYYDDMFCFAGVNLAVKDKTAIFGAPFAFTTGMATYAQLDKVLTPMAPIAYRGNDTTSGGIVYGSTSMNINGGLVYRTNTLKGYSVAIGHITRPNVYDYLVATPRWNIDNYVGSVEVFAFPNNGTPLAGPSPPLGNAWSFGVANAEALYNDSIGIYNSVMNVTANGTQTGEQFGYSMDTADLNQDGYDELIVGAPYYTDTRDLKFEVGRVYVFLNTKGGLSSTPLILSSTSPTNGGRFGHVVLSVGDINGDGTEDFAVGAPYETCTSPADNTVSTGSVYLYSGTGDTTNPAAMIQKITACDVRQASLSALNGSTLRSFGYSLASKADVDGNAYNDLAVGAYESRAVFLLRTFSVANVTVNMTNVGGDVIVTSTGCGSSYPCGVVRLCTTYSCSRSGSCSQNLNMTFTVSELNGRAFFNTSSKSTTTTVVVPAISLGITCANVTFYSTPSLVDLVSPFQFQATVRDFPRTLVSDSSNSLADFKAIPILKGASSTVAVGIARRCSVPNSCKSNLVLNQNTGPIFSTAGGTTESNLTVNETAMVALTFVVNNTGDEVAGINLVFSSPSTRVKGMTLTKMSATAAINCPPANNNTAVFICSNIVDGYLVQNNASKISVTLNLDVTSIPYDPTTFIFNVTSQDNETNLVDNVVMLQLIPSVSADVNLFSVAFSTPLTSYKSPTGGDTPADLSSIGSLVTMDVDIQKSGVTDIPTLTLALSLPQGGSDWNSFYLYPASLVVSPKTTSFSCMSGVLDPSKLVIAKRSVMMDMTELRRVARQTQTSSTQTIDCSSKSPSGCVNLICNISNITSTPTTTRVTVTFFVNDRYFWKTAGFNNVSVTATANVSIPSPPIFVSSKVVSKELGKATLNIAPLSIPTSQKINYAVIIVPIVASLVIIVIAVIALYACGFFKRKKRDDEGAVAGIDGDDAAKATIINTSEKKNPADDAEKL